MVLPKNYVSINSTEMEYVDGGWMSKGYVSAGCVKKQLDLVIACSAIGTVCTTALGALLGSLPGALIGAIVGGLFFTRILNFACNAHNAVENIIDKYGSSKTVCFTITGSLAIMTGMSVNVA